MNIENPQYESYLNVLEKAYERAAHEKGKERHVLNDESYEDQIICDVNRKLGSADGCLFQAVKKIYESKKIETLTGSKNELLDAINYLVAAVILIQEKLNVNR